MDRAVGNVTKFSNWGLRDAVRAATLNPARAVGLSGNYGVLAAGAPADFNVLSSEGKCDQDNRRWQRLLAVET